MSFTAKEVITDSFSIIGQYTDFKKPTDTNYDSALNSLNTMHKMWYRLGLRASYNQNTLTLDTVMPYGDYTRDSIAYGLTERMWKKFAYNVSIPPEVVMLSKDYINELWTINGPDVQSVFPGVLPIGEGNENYNYGNFNPFYPDCDESLYGCEKDQLSTDSDAILTGVKYE